MFDRVKNNLKLKFSKFWKNFKEGIKPKNIWANLKALPRNTWNKIKAMPRMDQVYWTKILVGITAGIIFGVANFKSWPAALTMLGIFVVVSTIWFLAVRNIEPGIKIRQYYMSAMFQYFITMIALWTIILNIMHVPFSDF